MLGITQAVKMCFLTLLKIWRCALTCISFSNESKATHIVFCILPIAARHQYMETQNRYSQFLIWTTMSKTISIFQTEVKSVTTMIKSANSHDLKIFLATVAHDVSATILKRHIHKNNLQEEGFSGLCCIPFHRPHYYYCWVFLCLYKVMQCSEQSYHTGSCCFRRKYESWDSHVEVI